MAFIVSTLNQRDEIEKYYCLSAKSTIECIWNVARIWGVQNVYINKASECFNGYLVNSDFIYGFNVKEFDNILLDRNAFDKHFNNIIKD